MNLPCVRIEVEYADGSKNIAQGVRAQRIVEWLRMCQSLAGKVKEIVEFGDPPQFQFQAAPESSAEPSTENPLSKTDVESAADAV